jgi:hypothetical protein
MKPQEMDQEKLLAWIKSYLERAPKDLEAMRDVFYDLVLAGDDEAAEFQLKSMFVKQGVHAMLLEEVMEVEEYQKMLELVQKLSEGAPEA